MSITNDKDMKRIKEIGLRIYFKSAPLTSSDLLPPLSPLSSILKSNPNLPSVVPRNFTKISKDQFER
ncbi:hypothetical protein L2E82_30474 [Cichorium intybus]|uniref:Uncharacterized protein n=1 Tax=Cichorium intybus TaxID=13427 RepID=A0ACB9D0H3_CICIN|nr:hypothetical protein L2E82_30474 [Cichorium intybus]